MKKFLPIILSIFLISCDPGFAVILKNNSKEPKDVEVFTRNNVPFLKDSVTITNGSLTYKQAVTLSTNNYSYLFTLSKKEDAILQQGIGGPDLSGKIIIDKNDTIYLDTDKRVKTTKAFMSTVVTIRINSSQ